MWAIDNQTPFAAERTFVRDRDGSEIWLVAVRATFDLFPDGSVQIANKQNPVVQAPEYFGKPGYSSLRSDTDLPRTKVGTDILLNASAHSPNSEDCSEVEVAFRLGDLEKKLVVSGEAVWEKTLGMSTPGPPQPFAALPIRYEGAFGGSTDDRTPRSLYPHAERNPVGTGIDTTGGSPLPTVRYPGTPLLKPSLRRPVPGFGAVAGSWNPRRQLAGTYDEEWQKEKRPLLPDDFQDAWFQSAPEDQITNGFLHGGEVVELTNLTPSGSLKFQLPRHSFGFRTSIDGQIEHHRANLHTVLIEPDDNRLIMVWHTALPCHHTLYTLRRTVVFEKQRINDREVAA